MLRGAHVHLDTRSCSTSSNNSHTHLSFLEDSPQHHPRPRHRKSTGAVSRNDYLANAQLLPSEWTGIGTDTITTHGHLAFDAQELRGGHPSCGPAPLTTSFGSVGQWERRHWAMVPSTRHSTLGLDTAPPSRFRRRAQEPPGKADFEEESFSSFMRVST